MRTLLSFSLLPLFLSLSSSSSPLHGSTTTKLIHDTCKTCAQNDPNVNFNFCTSSLQAIPTSRQSLRELGKISINLVLYNVTNANSYIKRLLKNKKFSDPYVKACLGDCFALYSDAIDSIKQAMGYYNYERYIDANTYISSVMDAATTCEDGFKEKRGVVSPLRERNNVTFELSAMALSIMHIIQTGS